MRSDNLRLQETSPLYCSNGAPAPDRAELARALLAQATKDTKWDSLQFHFMVDWQQEHPKLSGPLIVRYILFSPSGIPGTEEVEFLAEQAGVWNRMSVILGAQSQRAVIGLIILDAINTSSDTPIWILTLSGTERQMERKTLSWIRELVTRHSGPTSYMGKKGLTIGMSRGECFLAERGVIFPGDVDSLLLWQGEPKLIVEFKSHNLQAPLLNFDVSRYYPHPDGRKWNGLKALASGLKVNSSIPIAVFYYSTVNEDVRLCIVDPTGTKLSTLWDSGVGKRASAENIFSNCFNYLKVS
jgi:hypothetical protein